MDNRELRATLQSLLEQVADDEPLPDVEPMLVVFECRECGGYVLPADKSACDAHEPVPDGGRIVINLVEPIEPERPEPALTIVPHTAPPNPASAPAPKAPYDWGADPNAVDDQKFGL